MMLLNSLHRHLNVRQASPRCTNHVGARRPLRCNAVASPATTPPAPPQTESNHFTPEDLDAFLTAYTSIYEEHTLPITADMIDGTIPSELHGTYVRNVPGLLEIGGVEVRSTQLHSRCVFRTLSLQIPQPFDGDGMVAAFTFANGKALFRNKYVRTEAFVKEQAAGRMLYQGVFNKVGSEDTLFNNPFTLVRLTYRLIASKHQHDDVC